MKVSQFNRKYYRVKMRVEKSVIVTIGIIVAITKSVNSCGCSPPEPGEEICGSDGRTYSSRCILNCETIYRAHIGECLSKVAGGECGPTPCTCADPCKFVCASNGQTYGNDCILKCVQQQDPTITKVKNGICKIS